MKNYIFTSESITEGHPDKICDRIADSILDEALRQDPASKMAVEATIKDDFVLIYGEANTKAKLEYEEIAKEVIREIGYTEEYEVWIIYTQMINSMKVEAQMEQLLPLKQEDFSNVVIPADIHQEEIQMVPSPTAVMDHVVPNYVTGFIFGALVESFCSEQNARMMAMQSASDNAAELLNELSIEYNRVRQAAITQEITEVVGGARAQRKKRR